MAMNTNYIGANPMEANLTPEQEIRYLKSTLKDERIKKECALDKIDKQRNQVGALFDIACDLRNATTHLSDDLTWANRRMGDYRDVHHEATMACLDIITDYENEETGKPSKALYEFAKKIRDILGRI